MMADSGRGSAAGAGGLTADAFLSVETAKRGKISGESSAPGHEGEISVKAWNWGMEARTAMGGVGAATKASVRELTVVKGVDSSSTALMSCLRNNDAIKQAVLTMRKAGGEQEEFLRITISKGRITSIDVECGPAADPVERVQFAFQKIEVEYAPQSGRGQKGAGHVFMTDLTE